MKLEAIGDYWNTRAQGYSQTIHEQFENGLGDYFMERFKSLRPDGKELNCLDVGCGPGFFSIILNRLGYKVTSVDYSPEMVSTAEKNLNDHGFIPNVLRGDAQKLPFDSNTFDLVVSRDLVWNLEHPEKAYKEWARILKPGGMIFVVDGNHYLHYHDEDYRMAKDIAEMDSRAKHDLHGVDPTFINELARDLPLSKCLRPAWDKRVMEEVGMKNIDTDITYKKLLHPETGEEKMLVGRFELWGEKHSA